MSIGACGNSEVYLGTKFICTTMIELHDLSYITQLCSHIKTLEL